jgi:hypothetical protein
MRDGEVDGSRLDGNAAAGLLADVFRAETSLMRTSAPVAARAA